MDDYVTLTEPGKKAKVFTLSDQDGKKHALKDYLGKPVVLYFYPKDDTSGCTKAVSYTHLTLPTILRV